MNFFAATTFLCVGYILGNKKQTYKPYSTYNVGEYMKKIACQKMEDIFRGRSVIKKLPKKIDYTKDSSKTCCITFYTMDDAYKVLYEMDHISCEFGTVSVSDVMDILARKEIEVKTSEEINDICNNDCYEYGWNRSDLYDAGPKLTVSNEWTVEIPAPRKLTYHP